MDSLDWKWTAVHAAPIPIGFTVVLKMADAKNNLTYALGYVDENGKLQFTAREDENGKLAVYWLALPNS